jgi:type IV pilus assembly protein PilE
MTKRNKGFTLIEVMIVVAILGILAGIAYNSYSNQVMRSNRSDAMATLNDVSQRLQRCYTTYSAYDNDDCTVYQTMDGGVIESFEGFYEIDFEAGSDGPTTYTLVATPVEPPQTNDADCDDMSLSHTGRRDPEECW